MSRAVLRSVAALAALAAGAAAPPSWGAPEPLEVWGDRDYPPYEYLDEKGRPAGFDVDIARAVGEVMGLDVEVRLGHWPDVRADLEAGRIEVVAGMHASPERARKLDFSTPYVGIHHRLFVREGSPIRTLDDARGKAIVVQRETLMHDLLRRERITGDIRVSDSVADALRELASGKHDAALVPTYIGLYLIDRYHLGNLEPVGKPLGEQEYGFAVRKGHEKLLQRLNEGLAIIKANGEFQQIYARWFGMYDLTAGERLRKVLTWGAWALGGLALLALAVVAWVSSLRRQVRARTAALQHELTERLRAEQDRRRLEERLRHTQKLEALGRLAGGLAHDFKNVLAAINGQAELARMRLADPEAARVSLAEISGAAGRAMDLVAQLLAFARKSPFQTTHLALNDTIRSTLALLRAGLDPRIDVRTDLTPDEPEIMGDAASLESALLNLAFNSRDAMPDGGELVIATRVVELDAAAAAKRPGPPAPGRYVEVRVADSGTGIPSHLQDRVFEPFFTTKGPGQGTGLGLSGVYGAVKSHGGTIELESEAGQGTTFRILLPLLGAGAAGLQESAAR